MAAVLLRLVALARTRFWEGMKCRGLPSWNPTGFTIQLTLSVLKQDTTVAKPVDPSGCEESRLIET
jgi:hypothetical protein